MRRRSASLFISVIMVVSALSFIVSIVPENVTAKTLYVGGSGSDNYTYIQDAINASDPGDTIYVYNGVYNENVVVNKTLSLEGEDRNSTVIDGGWRGDVVSIIADWVNVSGFTIVAGGLNHKGISLQSVQNCHISNLGSFESGSGIHLDSSDDNTIDNNIASNNWMEGISLWYSHNNTFSNNDASYNNNGSFFLWESSTNIFSNNTASDAEYGFSLSHSPMNTIANNTISGNTGRGVLIYESDKNRITDNTISGNQDGVYIKSSDGNYIADNNVSLSEWTGVFLWYSAGNILTGNVMIEDGIMIMGSNVHWNTHIIDTSNSVNGNPVYYWKNVTGGKVASDAGQVILANCTDVTIEYQNMSNGPVGILLGYSRLNTITNINVSNSDDGISLATSDDNVITGNDISNNDGHGILLDYSYRNKIANNTVSSNFWYGIDLYHSDYNTIANNTVSNNWDGIYLDYSGRNIVMDNIISGSKERGLESWGPSNSNTIINNSISNSEYGISFRNSNRNVIESNTVSNTRWGISLLDATHFTLRGNMMIEDGVYLMGNKLDHWISHTIDSSNTVNGKPVRYLKNATGGTVPLGAGQVIFVNCTGVSVDSQDVSNGTVGILVGFSSANTVSNNTILSSSYDGVILWESNQNIVENNNISLSGWDGVYLRGFSNTFAYNVISDNLNDGISIADPSSGNTVFNNTISYNKNYGIKLYFSGSNEIYHNNIMDNAYQAKDNVDTNLWDNDYPLGGNYWSDYTGVDVKQGVLQDQPGSDGIGDTPYVIDSDSRDRYPLMSPVNIYILKPPLILQANLDGTNLENVKLIWSLSPDDGRGSDSVVAYKIYRNTTYNSEGLGYGLIATLPSGTEDFVDSLAGEGDPNNYFYRVCAIDVNNNISCSKNQAGKFTRSLASGLNLVSIPLIQSDGRIENVFQAVEWDSACSYNKSFRKWMWHDKLKPDPKELQIVVLTDGYWINVTEDSNLTVAGTVPFETDIYLRPGWNLVGFPSFNATYTVGDLKAETGAIRVEGFDPTAPPYFLRVMGDGEFLETGYGYWVYLESVAVWTVSNS